MANKNFTITATVNANDSDIKEYNNAIPLNKKWIIKKFGACDINLGDNKSSVYILRFDDEILKIISVTGNTYEIKLDKEITGNGIKKINIVRQNKSGFTKELPFWVTAYSKD